MPTMEKMKVRELMRPVDQFPRISSQVTVIEAVDALEKAQREYRAEKAPQRILMVYDDSGRIVGKLSPMDIVRGLEPNYGGIENLKDISRYGLSPVSIESMKEDFRLWKKPLAELCTKAYNLKIESFVKMPSPEHLVKVDDNMDHAFHLFVLTRHDSLFVMDGDEIVGLIRFSDVYREIARTMRECPVPA
jgi:CBS domain-containing protein